MTTAFQGSNHVLFAEPFEDTNFASRGWYDGDGGLAVDSAVYSPRSGGASINFHFGIGDTAPVTPRRHLFTATDTLYLSFDIKLGTSGTPWIGSAAAVAPHLIKILTDADTSIANAEFSFLSTYIEALQFIPLIGISDGARINVPQVGVDLLRSTTTHGVAGGNGVPYGSNFSEYHANGDGTYSDWSEWTYGNPGTGRGNGTPFFVNNTWHRVECFLKMNSIVAGAPVGDGIIRMWVDGTKVIDYGNVELRTAQYPSQKFNQFVLAPTMSSGSPIAQDLWIDNVLVADSPPDDDNGDFFSPGAAATYCLGAAAAAGVVSFTGAGSTDFVGYSVDRGEPSYCYDLHLRSDADRIETPLSYNPHLVSCLAKIPLQDGDIGSTGEGDVQMAGTAIASGDFASDGISTVQIQALETGDVYIAGNGDMQMSGAAVGDALTEIYINGTSDMQMVGDGGVVVPPTPTPDGGTQTRGDDMGGPAGRNEWKQQQQKKRKLIQQEDDELIAAIKEMARQIFEEETA